MLTFGIVRYNFKGFIEISYLPITDWFFFTLHFIVSMHIRAS